MLRSWQPPKFVWRSFYTLFLTGQVIARVLKRKCNMSQTLQQIARVGPDTLGVAMLTSGFVGLVFTIQFCKVGRCKLDPGLKAPGFKV